MTQLIFSRSLCGLAWLALTGCSAKSSGPDEASAPAGQKHIVLADYLGFSLPLLTVVNATPAFDTAHYSAYITKLKALGLRRLRMDFHWATAVHLAQRQ